MNKYRKKPVVAIQFRGYSEEHSSEIKNFLGKCFDMMLGHLLLYKPRHNSSRLITASAGDYICKDFGGRFYHEEPDIFEKTYKRVE